MCEDSCSSQTTKEGRQPGDEANLQVYVLYVLSVATHKVNVSFGLK